MGDEYTFGSLPLNGIRPGSTVLVAGAIHGGARDLALGMLAGDSDEGAILVTANESASSLVEACHRAGVAVTPERTAFIDCVGGEEQSVSARVAAVSSPADFTGIGMRFSDVYRDLVHGGVGSVRTGFYSVSTLLTFNDLQTVSRFVHTLVGRINSADGLGVLLIDPANHDDRAVSTISQFSTGRIDVRDTNGKPELRARGLPNQSRDWLSFDPVSRG